MQYWFYDTVIIGFTKTRYSVDVGADFSTGSWILTPEFAFLLFAVKTVKQNDL